MTILLVAVTILHVIVCLILIGVVLLQSGKAADLAGAFGGMGSQTTSGPRAAATVLTKATTGAAALFMVTSLSLAIIATKNGGATSSGTVLERTNLPAPPAATPDPSQTQAPAGAQPPASGQTPAVELIDESGRVVRKNEIEIPKDAKPGGPAVPVKIGKELPIDNKPASPVTPPPVKK
jgi:preprotein translocase subunit SecG